MIRKNKTIAKIMVLALCANTLPAINVFAAENLNGNDTAVVSAEENNNEKITDDSKINKSTTEASVQVKEDAENEDDFEFDAATGTITKYTGKDDKIVVPEEINGVKVVSIGEGAFEEIMFQHITKITLPETVETIEDNAFRGCIKLREINLPDELKTIGDRAFDGCVKLQSIDIPESVTEIGAGAFSDIAVKDIVIPKNVTEISKDLLRSCNDLENVTIEGDITSIGDYAFQYDESLKTINIPSSVEKIGSGVFMSTNSSFKVSISDDSIKQLLIKAGVKEGQIDTVNEQAFEFDKATGTILKYKGNDEKVTIPERINGVEVKAIGEYAFYYKNVTEVVLPDTVTTIGDYAFTGTKISSLSLPDAVRQIGEKAFGENDDLISAALPEGLEEIPNAAFYHCDNLKEVNIPESVTKIEKYAFWYCNSLKEVYVPDAVKEIGEWAFDFRNVEKITVSSEEVKELLLNSGMYESKIELKKADLALNEADFEFDAATGTITKYIGKDDEIVVPKEIKGVKVVSIGEKAFEEMMFQHITKITLPDTIETIKDDAFRGCIKLKEINLPKGLKKISDNIFFGCSLLENIDIPEGVTEIGRNAFADCRSLGAINIPESVTKLGERALSSTGIKNIVIPKNVTEINNGLFEYCRKLENVTIDGDITSIKEWAFSSDTNLKSISLPSSVEAIDRLAFYDTNSTFKVYVENNDSVKQMLIKAGVKEDQIGVIKEDNFEFDAATGTVLKYKGNDKEVVIPNKIKGVKVNAIGEYAFYDCKNLSQVSIPEGIEEIQSYAFGNTGISSLSLPSTLKEINEYAFTNCDNITSVTIPEGIAELKDGVFYHCDNLNEVNIPESVTRIDNFAFWFCNNLKQVYMPDEVKQVGDYSFSRMTKFTVSNEDAKQTLIDSGVMAYRISIK